MSNGKVQRSRDALAGGVCAGIAARLGIDAVVARILMVLACLLTFGAGVVVYAILWAVLPLEPASDHPVDVEPREVTSETYGERGAGPAAAAMPAPDRGLYASAGHEPPEPPLAAQAAAAAVAARMAAGEAPWAAPGAGVAAPGPVAGTGAAPGAFGGASAAAAAPGSAAGAVPGPAGADPAGAVPASGASAAASAVAPEGRRAQRGRSPFAKACLSVVCSLVFWACLAALFIGILRLVGGFIQGASWWRLWPLFFTVSGIAVMAVPGKSGRRMAHAVTGWFLLAAGSVVLPMSLRLVSWVSLVPWLWALWPVLVASACCLAVGWVRRSWPWALAAGVLFGAFCFGGLLLFAEPGPAPFILVELPLGRDLVFRFPF